MPDNAFPATAPWFIPISTPAKSRIFKLVHDQSSGAPPMLEQVATVNAAPESAERLVDALNSAAWTGSRSELEEMLAALPEAVAQSCLKALEACPDPREIAVAYERPMSVIRRVWFTEGGQELARQAGSAMDVGLQFLVTNGVDERGAIEFEAALLSDDCEVWPRQAAEWWPNSTGAPVLDRWHPSPTSLVDAFQDERWETHVGRAYWAWVKDSGDADECTATAEWVFEFLDAPLEPDRNFRIFVAEDNFDEESRGFLTTRTRFLLWLALRNMCADLDGLVVEWDDFDSIVREDMPPIVQAQAREWWRQMYRSAERLCEAARRGTLDQLVPRTVAEEALISLATRDDYIDWARDAISLYNLEDAYRSLPVSEDDEVWEEILGGLTGDIDVEIVWDDAYMGRADPADRTNQEMGIGDYRPTAWHRLFERAIASLTFDEKDGI